LLGCEIDGWEKTICSDIIAIKGRRIRGVGQLACKEPYTLQAVKLYFLHCGINLL
jgi:hypothetical protein